MSKPLIQIDDVVREMTEQEHATYLEMQRTISEIQTPTDTDTDDE